MNKQKAEDERATQTKRSLPLWPGRRAAWLALCLCLPRLAAGVILYGTGDPTHNTNAPTGALANSGWQYQGAWSYYLGTPVSSNFFLTAHHVGGAVGDLFHFQGVDYPTVAWFDDPSSDLRLWRICGTFLDFAPLYSQANESGKMVVVFGRGTQRGAEVVSTNLPVAGLKGWEWGPTDSVERWGTNVVSSIYHDSTVGDMLRCAFDASGGADEAHLSVGDSGGGVFIKSGATWKLAGINYSVDGPFNTSTNGPGFNAAIFDEGGLYEGGEGNWVAGLPGIPSTFYATRVSAHLAWITSTLQSPLPRLLAAANIAGPYFDMPNAVVDSNGNTVTVPVPSGTQFYRLQGCNSSRITGLTNNGTMLIISYQ